MKRIIQNTCAILLAVMLFSSCVSYKNVPYFQDLDSAQTIAATTEFKQPVIQKNDLLGVYINSLSPELISLFGVSVVESQETGTSGFLVDANGEIQIPTIGKLKVEGLTTLEAGKLLTEKAAFYVKEPSVTVRILNFKISVTGEVLKAGVYPVPNEKISIVEAISLAGDMKITGKRENVMIIRQRGDKTEFGFLDMRSKNIFKSPYYYLKNNDVVYVEPNVQRLERDDNIYKNTTVIISVLTAAALIIFRLGR